jgi:hypothetical protein
MRPRSIYRDLTLAWLGDPVARARWLMEFSGDRQRTRKQLKADRVMASSFSRGRPTIYRGAEPWNSDELLLPEADVETLRRWARDVFGALRLREPFLVELTEWKGALGLNDRRRVRGTPHPWLLGGMNGFRWQAYETLSGGDVTVGFCERRECGAPFVVRKNQRYCAKCAPSAADRNRAYRVRHREELNKRRRRAYERKMRKLTGGKVHARKPS